MTSENICGPYRAVFLEGPINSPFLSYILRKLDTPYLNLERQSIKGYLFASQNNSSPKNKNQLQGFYKGSFKLTNFPMHLEYN